MTGEDSSGQPEDVYLQGVVFRDEATGLDEFHLCVGGQDPTRIEDAILAGFNDAIGRHTPRLEFGGGIRIVILREITPQTGSSTS